MKNLITIFILIAFMLSASAAFSQGRDSDGTRMQARSIQIGSSIKDSISSPKDRVDWYYFQVKKGQKIQVSLISKKGKPSMALLNAMGKTLSSGRNISQTLNTGIYYISISGKGSFLYTLSVR